MKTSLLLTLHLLLLAFRGSHGQDDGPVTCGLLQQIHQTAECCPSQGGTASQVINPECQAKNEFEAKCLQLGQTKFASSGGNIHQIAVRETSGVKYCWMAGALQDDIPFEIALPEPDAYENRLIARGGFAYDSGLGKLQDYDLGIMASYKASVAHLARNGNMRNADAEVFANGAASNWDEYLFAVHTNPRRHTHDDVWNGAAWKSLKRMINEASGLFYGAPPAHSYMWGCSGAATNAVINGVSDPNEWDGVYAVDFFEPTLYSLKALNLLAPHHSGELSDNAYALTAEFVRFFCDSPLGDGIEDGVVQYDCVFPAKNFQCDTPERDEMEATLPAYADFVAAQDLRKENAPGSCLFFADCRSCLTDDEAAVMHPIYNSGLRLPNGNALWNTELDSLEHLQSRVTPSTARQVAAEFEGSFYWAAHVLAGNSELLGSSELYPELAALLKERTAELAAAIKAGEPYDSAQSLIDIFWNDSDNYEKFFWKFFDQSVISQGTNEKLQAFKTKGGKMILVQRDADTLSTSESFRALWLRFFKSQPPNAKTVGTRQAVDPYVIGYLLPSLGHCGSASGDLDLDGSSFLSDLVNWVEGGVTPEQVNYYVDGEDTGKPVCRYPTTWQSVDGEDQCACTESTGLCGNEPPAHSGLNHFLGCTDNDFYLTEDNLLCSELNADSEECVSNEDTQKNCPETCEMEPVCALCADNPDFRDEWGQDCNTWSPYWCSVAGQYGFDQVALYRNCPITCGLGVTEGCVDTLETPTASEAPQLPAEQAAEKRRKLKSLLAQQKKDKSAYQNGEQLKVGSFVKKFP